MKKVMASVIVLFMCLFMVSAAFADEGSYKLNYGVKVDDYSSGIAHISLTVENYNSDRLDLVKKNGNDNDEKIGAFKVKDEAGNELPCEKTRNKWSIGNIGARKIYISYDINSRMIQDNQYYGYIGEDFGIFEGGQLFIYPENTSNINKDTISITFDIPRDSELLSPWPEENGAYYPGRQITGSGSSWDIITNLIRPALGFGSFDKLSQKVGDTSVTTAVPKSWESQRKKEVADSIFALLGYYTNLFGNSVADSYMVIYSPNTNDGYTIWAGEFSYSQATNGRDNEYKYDMIGHQMFHRWNGWLWGWDWNPQAELKLLMGEGLNRYYEAKALQVTKDKLYQVNSHEINYLEELYKQYKEKDKSSPYIRATEDDWLTAYNQGAVTCFALDMQIQEDTNYTKSLDDVVRLLFEKYAYRKGSMTRANVINAIKDVTGNDYSQFFDDYVYGTRPLWLEPYFADRDKDGISNQYELSRGTDPNVFDDENEIKVYLNGKKIYFDVKPQKVNGRTLVPFRKIFEIFGATVEWNKGTRTATGITANTKVELTLGEKFAYTNGNRVELDVPPTVVNGNTLVPLRFISESLGADVDWDADTESVIITATK